MRKHNEKMENGLTWEVWINNYNVAVQKHGKL